MTRRRLGAVALAATLVALGLAGCGRHRLRMDRVEETLAVASTRPGILAIRIAYRPTPDSFGPGSERPLELVIDSVTKAPGAAPRLVDGPALEGRIELLDRSGRVVWSMGYRPLPEGSVGGTLLLRAPLLPAARTVLVREPGRGYRAEAPIGRGEQ